MFGKMYEVFFGRMGDSHLTVSKAFKSDIATTIGVPLDNISVLYDRAVKGKFKQLSLLGKHHLFERIDL